MIFTVARKYFLSKQSQRAINLISIAASVGVMIGTAALVIVLSVFNGFENLVITLYDSFDPDIRIESVSGKSFERNEVFIDQLKKTDGVQAVSACIEENALAKNGDKQLIVTLKGVDENFNKVSGIDSMVIDGNNKLNVNTNHALIGSVIAYKLNIRLNDIASSVNLFVPNKHATSLNADIDAFNKSLIVPHGVFEIQQEYDQKYILVPLSFAKEFFQYDNRLTSLELSLKKNSDAESLQKQIQKICGNNFKVLNRFQQHESIYRVMQAEKWIVYFILTFILIIATFNIAASLTMLMIDKQKDIFILSSMGANTSMLRKIFIAEGLMVVCAGAFIGIVGGVLFCWLQQTFGLIQLPGNGSFLIENYPVKIQWPDVLATAATVLVIGGLAALYPSFKIIRSGLNLSSLK